jgi:tripartite-type tricarboxylate transporter receptor subunit TctC
LIRYVCPRLILAATLAAAAGTHARAQDFPNRSITIVVGLAAGGVTDVTTRQYAEAVAKRIGQSIIIENRPVAGGAVAAATVQNALPDGYTLLSVVGSQFSSVPAMGSSAYDPINGFAPITLLFHLPTLVVVPFNSPAHSMAELLELGKKKPGGILLGSPGAGSPGHLLAALISMGTGTPMQYVHYRGGAALMADLVTGRVDFSLASYNSARSHMQASTLRALAVDADKRLPALPDVPTLTETGLGQYKVGDWCGLLAPAATPRSVIAKLNAEFVSAAQTPELIKELTDNGNLIASSTPEEMSTIVREEVKKLGELIVTLGLNSK